MEKKYLGAEEIKGLFFNWKNKKAFLIKISKDKRYLNCWLLDQTSKKKEKFVSTWAVSIVLNHLTTSFILIKDFRVTDKVFLIEEPVYKGYALELDGNLVKISQAAVVEAKLNRFNFGRRKGIAFANNGKKIYLPLSKLVSQQREILPGKEIRVVLSEKSVPWAEIWEISKGGENGFSVFTGQS